MLNQQWFTPPAWLMSATNAQTVAAELRKAVPEFVTGELVLSDCEVKRLRFRESQGCWSGIYLLTVAELAPSQSAGQGAEAAPPAPTASQFVAVHGALLPPGLAEPQPGSNGQPFGAEAWSCYLPTLRLSLRTQPPDAELAALPQLTDPEAARCLLEESIRTGAPAYHDLHIASCTPRVMRYKPGSRCTILYHLAYPPTLAEGRNWPALVVAKTHHGSKGQNAYAGMKALWESPLGSSETVAIAEPLAYLPAQKVLVQGPIREEATLEALIQQTLRAPKASGADALAISDELRTYVCKTAAGLAELHQCGIDYGETVTWADEMAEICEGRAKLAAPLPQLASLAEDLLAQLQKLAAQHPADPLAPAHRSFRPAQVLLHQGKIGFIDFDGVCQAEPALDIALFMTTVKNIGLRKSNLLPQAQGDAQTAQVRDDEDDEESDLIDAETRLLRLRQAEAICELFLTEYEKHATVSRERVFLWETLDLLSLVLGSWLKLKLGRLDNCLFMLERHLLRHQDKLSNQ